MRHSPLELGMLICFLVRHISMLLLILHVDRSIQPKKGTREDPVQEQLDL